MEPTNFTALQTETLYNATVVQFSNLYIEEFLVVITTLALLWPAIILFGLGSNIINIIVFLTAGAKDNVSVLLLSLAISDLVFLTIITPVACSMLIYAYIPSFSWPFDPPFLQSLPYWPAYTAYDLSSFISVSLGVMRCACVAMPLKFKLVFTRSRTVKWVLFLFALAVSLRAPILSVFRVAWKINPQKNISEPYLLVTNYDSMIRINDTINRGFVIYISYISMMTCVAVLIFKLYQAVRLRRLCTSKNRQASDEATGQSSDEGLSGKDLQVVKSVVLICTLFVVLQFPFLLGSTARLILSELDSDFNNRFFFLFAIFTQADGTCSYLNASLNIFIYVNYNSKYRAIFQSLLLSKKSA